LLTEISGASNLTQYPRAPITEAVIEIKFEAPVEPETVKKALPRLRDAYQSGEDWSMQMLEFDIATGAGRVQRQATGYKLTSLDGTDICIISTTHISVSRLAPYSGWDAFYARAQRDWQFWKRGVAYRKISRLGLRYINRIDIPVKPGSGLNLQDYLNIYPELPEGAAFPPMAHYTMQVIMPRQDQWGFVVNAGSVPSPLLNHSSFVLDIDLGRDADVPQRDEDVWELIGRARTIKNTAFESCITDMSRALFSR
jgi:uncharacterized protein (TIGR04255 family)